MKPQQWRGALVESDLDRTARLVGLVLSVHMNGAGDTFVGKERLRREAGLNSVRSVDGAINRLEQAGYVTVVRKKGGGGSWDTHKNHYLASTPHGGAGITPQADAGSWNGNPASDDKQPRISRQTTPHGAAPEVERESVSESVYYLEGKGARSNERAQPREVDHLGYLDE